MKKLIAIFAYLFITSCVYAQLHDFDSLFTKDDQYRKAIESRPDAEDIFTGDAVLKMRPSMPKGVEYGLM